MTAIETVQPGRHPSTTTLDAFVRRHDLAADVATARRLALEEFRPASEPRVGLETDPETGEQWVEIAVSVAAEPPEALDAYHRYTQRWLASAAAPAVPLVRLAFDLVQHDGPT